MKMNEKLSLKKKILKLWKYTVLTFASVGAGGICMFGFLLIMLQFDIYLNINFSFGGLVFWTVCAWMLGFTWTFLTLNLREEMHTYFSESNKRRSDHRRSRKLRSSLPKKDDEFNPNVGDRK